MLKIFFGAILSTISVKSIATLFILGHFALHKIFFLGKRGEEMFRLTLDSTQSS
jgi:hypothetical protein